MVPVVLPDEIELKEDIEQTELFRDPMEEGEEGGVAWGKEKGKGDRHSIISIIS